VRENKEQQQDLVRRPINLLVVIRHPVGGIRSYLRYTYSHLDRTRYRLTIITVHDRESELIMQELKEFNPKMIRVNIQWSGLGIPLKVFREVVTGHYDLIHSHGYSAGALACIGNFFNRRPHVITPHHILTREDFQFPWGRLKRWVLSRFFLRANVIQSVGMDAQENLLEFLFEMGLRRDKLYVIRNGISPRRLPEGDESGRARVREDLGVGNHVFLFGFLGRFMKEKGFLYLVDAVEEIVRKDQWRGSFKVVAVNDGAYMREYESVIRHKGLSNYFQFMGFVDDVSGIYSSLDALVVPSLWEACPLVPMEALVMGCPVIATDCIGLREVVADTPALVVKAGDAASLADGMRKVMKDPVSFKRETRAFSRVAGERFYSKKTAEALERLFQDVLNPVGGGRSRCS